MVDAPTEPADLTTLARRRRIAHLIAVALLIVMIVALTFSPNDDNDTSAASLIVGLSAILLLATGMTSVQYTVRIDRRRRARKAAARVVTTSELTVPAGSAAYQPIQQLRSAHRLLESALPDIEPVRKGIGAAAEQTRSSLEQTGRRVLLQEQVLATLSGSAEPGELRIAETRHNLKTMTDRLQSGVDRYLGLAQQATITAISLGPVSAGDNLQDATDQLAGLADGLRQVQQISAEHS